MGTGIQISVPDLLRDLLRYRNGVAVFLVHNRLMQQGQSILGKTGKHRVCRVSLIFADSLRHLIRAEP